MQSGRCGGIKPNVNRSAELNCNVNEGNNVANQNV